MLVIKDRKVRWQQGAVFQYSSLKLYEKQISTLEAVHIQLHHDLLYKSGLTMGLKCICR
jgi:hypothetical protein